jgi:chromate transporter
MPADRHTAGGDLTPVPVSVLALGLALLRLGAFAFGGMGSTLALLRSDLGARRGWITDQDVAEALAITQTLPGSTGVQVVAFLGWKLAGWPGALIAPFSFVAVPAAMMIAASAAVAALPDIPAVRGALLGIQIAVIGVLAANMLKMARSTAKGRVLSAVLIGGLLIGAFSSAAVAVVSMGALGAFLALRANNEGRDG